MTHEFVSCFQVVSITASTSITNQGELIFFIVDKGAIILGANVATTMNKVAHSRMSAVLGVEVRFAFNFLSLFLMFLF